MNKFIQLWSVLTGCSVVQTGDRFPHHRLHALSSSCSDHAPLLLHTGTTHSFHRRFIFESIWPRFSGFLDAVAVGWNFPVQNADAF
jgi:hypothetical protein